MADQLRQRLVRAGVVLGLCPCGLCNLLASWAEVAAAAGSGRSAVSVAGGGGRLVADQQRQPLVGAGVVLGLCPRGLHNALAAWVADQLWRWLVGAGGVLKLCPRSLLARQMHQRCLGFALAACATHLRLGLSWWRRRWQAAADLRWQQRQRQVGGRLAAAAAGRGRRCAWALLSRFAQCTCSLS